MTHTHVLQLYDKEASMHLKRTLIIKTVTKNNMNIIVSNNEGSKQIITQLAKYFLRFFD